MPEASRDPAGPGKPGERSQRGASIDRTPPSPHTNDPALVQACLDGDERAWEELVDRYGRLVYSVPRRIGLTAEEADDVFQNTFAALLQHLGGLRDQSRLSAWLITTARRESWRMGRARRVGAPLDEHISDGAAAPSDDVERWDTEQRVHEAMRRLDDRCRNLLTALFLEPSTASYETIAVRFAMPVGSIGPTRARCFRKLETFLRQAGVDTAN